MVTKAIDPKSILDPGKLLTQLGQRDANRPSWRRKAVSITMS